MKKTLFTIVIICLLFAACSKESNSEIEPLDPSKADSTVVQNYSDNHDIEEIMDETLPTVEQLAGSWRSYLRDFEWHNIAYNYEDIEQIIKDTPSVVNVEGEFAQMLPPINNDISIENIILPCGMETFIEGEYETRVGTRSNSYTMPGNWGIHPISPVAVLRQTEPGFYYAVYALENGGRLYRFFAPFKITVEDYEGDIHCYDDMTNISLYGSLYTEGALQYSDFSSISVGDSIKKVRKIDSAVDVYMFAQTIDEKAHSDRPFGEYLATHRESRHLLKEGLLTIYYELDGKNWVVSKMDFSEDFIYTSPYTKKNKPFRILPQDYPPAE